MVVCTHSISIASSGVQVEMLRRHIIIIRFTEFELIEVHFIFCFRSLRVILIIIVFNLFVSTHFVIYFIYFFRLSFFFYLWSFMFQNLCTFYLFVHEYV